MPVTTASDPAIGNLKNLLSLASLQPLLANHWPWFSSGERLLTAAEIERVHPATDRYVIEVALTWQENNQSMQAIAFGEVIGADCKQHANFINTSLRKRRRRQLPRKAVEISPVCDIEEYGLVMRLWSLDERLPALGALRSPRRLIEPLQCAFGQTNSVADVSVQFLGHKLGKRCVARLAITRADSTKHTVIAKAYKERGNQGETVFRNMQKLQSCAALSSHLAISEPCAWINESRLLLMEDVEGTTFEQLDAHDVPVFVQQAGVTLRALHSLPIANFTSPSLPHHQAADEIAIVQLWQQLAASFEPELRARRDAAVALLAIQPNTASYSNPCIIHRDFYEKQLLLKPTGTTLIDFDTLSLGCPMLDVGNFLAHLYLGILKSQTSPQENLQGSTYESLSDSFLAGYFGDEVCQLEAINPWLIAALLRLSCLYGFWPRWKCLAPILLSAAEGILNFKWIGSGQIMASS